MAKNWTIAEAVVKIKENDFASIKDIGGRFALFEHLCAKAIAGDGEAFVELMSRMPEHMTVGKIEKVLKAEIEGNDGEEVDEAEGKDEEKVQEKPKRGRAKKTNTEEPEDNDEDEKSYEDMTPQELFKECKKRGIKAEPKQKAAAYIKLLKADDKKANEVEDDDDWGDEEPEEKKPAKKSAPKAEKKKPEPKDDEDDDWDI